MKSSGLVLSLLAAIVLFASSCNNKNVDESSTAAEEPVAEQIERNPVREPSTVSAINNDTLVLPSGLKMIISKEGDGPRPTPGKNVKVHYTGFLLDGTIFDSSVERNQPIEFKIGTGAVIKGWDEGLSLMTVGSVARLIIPHELGYGKQGYGNIIPPSATLIFDVQLLEAE